MQSDVLKRLDAGGMYDALRSFPAHLREGRERAAHVRPRVSAGDFRCVLIAGMGGSAIGADLLAALAASSAGVPVVVSRSYSLPAFVDEETVVIISSYSGNTEETLSAMDDADERGAKLLCVTSGGQVGVRADAAGIPCYLVPGGMQPRAALGYALSTLITIAEQIELFRTGAEAWEEADTILREQGDILQDLGENPALEIAERLRDRVPFVYSGSGLMAPVNTRWCCQLEENAKVLAHGSLFPEQNHNEIVGWEVRAPLHDQIVVLALRDRMDHPRVAQRLDLTRSLLEEKAAGWIDVQTRGGSELARMLSLVQLGDWVSLYLALIRDVDPTPVRLIDRLKQAL